MCISIHIFLHLLKNNLQNVVVDMRTNTVVIFVKQSMNYNYIICFIYNTLYYCSRSYVILNLKFILLLIYNLVKGSNSKIKLVRSRLWQLEVLVREADGGGGNTIHGLLSSYLHFP